MKRIAILNAVLTSALNQLSLAYGGIIVNEIAYAGSDIQCDGTDWVELYNDAQGTTSLENYTLHDDKGPDNDEAKIFPSNQTLAAGEYKVLCKGVDFEFGIGWSDTITLLDGEGVVVSSSGVLPGTGGDNQSYAFFSGEWKNTTTATPGAENVYTEPEKTMQELLDEQNELSKDFFRLNDDGSERTSSTFDPVVDLYVDMEASSYQEIKENPGDEEYVPFTSVRVVSGDNTTFTVGGRIRTRGQSTLSFPACLGLTNVPFRLDFDDHLFGLETAYLRNHLWDHSYMREYATHRLNARFGLPFLRTRAVRLYLNDEYTGFYTMMEAPDQAYVMQRSFGPFDPTQTAWFKFKTMVADCPYTDEEELARAEERPMPDPYYFERGDHRDNIPVLGTLDGCMGFFFGQILKERDDMIKGYVENDRDCSVAMVNIGRIDRDFGPKALEDAMISFLQSHIYNATDPDLKNAVDANQWLKNFASYAVMLNLDSPIYVINNWYLATTSGGVGDWRIVQYDHNNVASRLLANLCSSQCEPRQIYWPILRPTCGAVEDHPIVGPILNDDNSRNVYLGYVEEFVNLLSPEFFREMREHGASIQEFVVHDPLSNLTASQYQDTELSSDFGKYNTEQSPFLQVLEARKGEVQKQLDAIRLGVLPRNGQYGTNEICPDWRDSDGENYLNDSTFVSSASCPSECEEAGPCYESLLGVCAANGTMSIEECKRVSPSCDACFPYSFCGTSDDDSGVIVESDQCDDDLYESCIASSLCFDHRSGNCAFDGEILTEECKLALSCKTCFPKSRCGEELPEAKDSESNILLPGRYPFLLPLILLLVAVIAI